MAKSASAEVAPAWRAEGAKTRSEGGDPGPPVAEQLAPEDVGQRDGQGADPDQERREGARAVDPEGVHHEEETGRVARAVDGQRRDDLGEAVEEHAGAVGERRKRRQVLVRRLERRVEDVEPPARAVAGRREGHAQHEGEGECGEGEGPRGQSGRAQPRCEERGRGEEHGHGRGGPGDARLEVADEGGKRRAQRHAAPVEGHPDDDRQGHARQDRDRERRARPDGRLAAGGAELGRHGAGR